MLGITGIRINGCTGRCITDRQPNIAFALESDVQGEALEHATITVGDWHHETQDQLNNLYDGSWKPFTSYRVHIEATGLSGEQAEAEAIFETGRLDTPWQAKWITDGSYDFPDKVSPRPMTFMKDFQPKKPVKRALVHATALGIYELSINGTKVGEDYFAPGLTSYEHQIQYQTYDVTPMLAKDCRITAVVAGGWAAGSFNYQRTSKISADRQAFLMEIRIVYEDGTNDVLITDDTWRVTEDGNYKSAEWYDGETYDATVDLREAAFKPVTITRPRGTPRLLAQYGSPVRMQERLTPVLCGVSPDGELVYDFGQNFAGVISARINGRHGQRIVIRHTEVLYEGKLFTRSLRTAKAEAVYICRDGEQAYSPRLTYMGFRYVGVSGVSAEDLALTAIVLHSDMETTGSFSCSNALLNRLNENIRWGGKSNFVDIPTDCPQRDERQGWTGDIAVFASTACFLFDMESFLQKWLMDMRSEQSKGGGIPMVIPRCGDKWPAMATSCWGDSCITVPWEEYLARGNKELLSLQYPAMTKFLKAAKWWSSLFSFTPTGRYIWRFPFHFGDWCASEGSAKEWIQKGKWVATAYFANSCELVAQIAGLLGKKEDEAYYRALREKIVKAYRKAFTDGKGRLKKEFQTAYVLPLHFSMTGGTETGAMAQNLVRLIHQAGNHLTTGFTGTPYLLFALSDNGYVKEAYDVLLQESCPSWLYEVKAGGTTIWERWDALRADGMVNITDLKTGKDDETSGGGMVSFNHYANGAVGAWLYRRMAGIEPLSGGYRSLRVMPVPGGGITWAKASVKTPFGTASSSWEICGDVFTITVAVPVSAECTLVLPNGDVQKLSSGRHTYSCPMVNTGGMQ